MERLKGASCFISCRQLLVLIYSLAGHKVPRRIALASYSIPATLSAFGILNTVYTHSATCSNLSTVALLSYGLFMYHRHQSIL